jgi:hypothetical protein
VGVGGEEAVAEGGAAVMPLLLQLLLQGRA